MPAFGFGVPLLKLNTSILTAGGPRPDDSAAAAAECCLLLGSVKGLVLAASLGSLQRIRFVDRGAAALSYRINKASILWAVVTKAMAAPSAAARRQASGWSPSSFELLGEELVLL